MDSGALRKPSVISLFTGAGGLDYGLEAAGFRVAVALEMDPSSCQTLQVSRRHWPIIARPIEQVTTKEILRKARLRRRRVDLLAGGPPCQPFSKAGYWAHGSARRLRDPRAITLHEFLRVVEEALPKVVLLENVTGLRYSCKDEGIQLLERRLAQINRKLGTHYRAAIDTLNAADFGVPQLRERVFVVAARSGKLLRFPKPTHAPLTQLNGAGLRPYTTCWDALAGLKPDPGEDLQPHGQWADLLPSIPEGSNYLHHTSRGGGKPLFGWRTRYWTFLLKLAKDRPSWTIQAQPGPAAGPFHWDSRRLSARELCRLQTFPDDVTIVGSRAAVQRQIGNAVPSLLAEVLGREIRVQLLSHTVAKRRLHLMPARRGTSPPAARRNPVPRRYLALVAHHRAHPGTGRGPGARRRRKVTATAAAGT